MARKLNLSISVSAAMEIKNIDLSDIVDPSPDQLAGIGIISIAIAVIVAANAIVDEELPIVDFSGIEKL